MKHVYLELNDVHPDLPAAALSRLQAIQGKPRAAVRIRKDIPLVCRDWRDVARRFLARVFPGAYIYRGGSHLAVHARRPTPEQPDAGACYLRLMGRDARKKYT